LGVAALVLGIIGTILALIPGVSIVGAVLGIVAVILGAVGRKSAAANNTPTGSATAGLVLGIIGLVIGVAMFILCAMAMQTAKKGFEKEFEKALNDPELKKKLNDPKLDKEFDDAFKKALEDQKKALEQPK
jgi:hypothetical protein